MTFCIALNFTSLISGLLMISTDNIRPEFGSVNMNHPFAYGLILFFLLLGRPARFDDAQSLETFINTFTLPSPAISLTSNGFDGGKSN